MTCSRCGVFCVERVTLMAIRRLAIRPRPLSNGHRVMYPKERCEQICTAFDRETARSRDASIRSFFRRRVPLRNGEIERPTWRQLRNSYRRRRGGEGRGDVSWGPFRSVPVGLGLGVGRFFLISNRRRYDGRRDMVGHPPRCPVTRRSPINVRLGSILPIALRPLRRRRGTSMCREIITVDQGHRNGPDRRTVRVFPDRNR